jgi:hypothetical protein
VIRQNRSRRLTFPTNKREYPRSFKLLTFGTFAKQKPRTASAAGKSITLKTKDPAGSGSGAFVLWDNCQNSAVPDAFTPFPRIPPKKFSLARSPSLRIETDSGQLWCMMATHKNKSPEPLTAGAKLVTSAYV